MGARLDAPPLFRMIGRQCRISRSVPSIRAVLQPVDLRHRAADLAPERHLTYQT